MALIVSVALAEGRKALKKRVKVLMPIGDASEVLDTFYAYYRLPEDGFDVADPVRDLPLVGVEQ